MVPRQLPNVLTIARLVLVAPIAIAILGGWYSVALVLFVAAGMSDAVDGFLARHYHWQTALGGILDPIADKALLIATFLSLALVGRLPWWLFAVVMLRDLIIGVGALAYRFGRGPFHAEPLLISKLTTLVQLALVCFLLLPWDGPAAEHEGLEGLFLLCLAMLVASGASYVYVWGERALGRPGERSP